MVAMWQVGKRITSIFGLYLIWLKTIIVQLLYETKQNPAHNLEIYDLQDPQESSEMLKTSAFVFDAGG